MRMSRIARTHRRFKLSAGLCFFASIGLVGNLCLAQQSSSEVLAELVQHREALDSGELEVYVRCENGRSRDYRIVFSGDKMRCDTIGLAGEAGNPYTRSVAFDESEQEMKEYSDEQFEGGGNVVATIRRITSTGRLLSTPHPRRFGTRAVSLNGLNHFPMESLYTEENLESTQVEREEIRGHECARIVLSNDVSTSEVWVDVARDFNPIQIRCTSKGLVETLETELSRIEGYGWFPSQMRYFRQSEGESRRQLTETVRIEVNQFNQPVDQDRFTFAGMGMPDGHHINDHFSEPGKIVRRVLRDGELVQVDRLNQHLSRNPNEMSMDSQLNSFARYTLLGVSIIAAVGAIWIYWKRRR